MSSFQRLLCGWILIQSAIIYGQCTTAERCPQNENYVRCVNPCNTCAERGVCLDKSKPHCASGCDCIKGYFRNSHGKCVPEHLCDGQQCKADEQYYANKPDCKNTCERYNNPGVRCAAGKPGCFCKQGLVKRKDGKCVSPKDCFPVTNCGHNEQFSTCVNPCNDCYTRGRCAFLKCNKGCDCIKGYYRDENRKCIPASRCPKDSMCDYFEEYKTCGTACQATCSNPKPICTKQCVKGCFCKKGYIRERKGGPCIDKSSCTTGTCGLNEEYKACGTACQPTCDDPNPVCTDQCVKGCFCKKGFIRVTKNGPCIDKRFCIRKPPCPPMKCPRGCYVIENAKPCPICDCGKPTVPPCPQILCKEGCTLDNSAKPCPKCKCPEPPCPPMKCPRGCYVIENAKPCPICDCGKPTVPPCPQIECKEGCTLDNSAKPCPKCKCPEDSCGPDEQFYDCKPFCANRCTPSKVCPRICLKGCYCRPGLVQDDDGKCVRKEDCGKKPNCKKDEQYYQCKPVCNNTCENYNSKNKICPHICASGCACKEGLVLRKDGTCVKPEKCKETGTNCPQYKCGPGCYLDSSTKPCPMCACYQKYSDEPKSYEDEDQYESSYDFIDEYTGSVESFFSQLVEYEANDEEATEERGEQESYEASEDDESERDEDSSN